MSFRRITVLSIYLCFVFVALTFGNAQRQEQHATVALRMVGHLFLQNIGDSTSRVLPIKQEGNSYSVSFESEFSFDPDTLINIANRVITENDVAEGYNVQVISCNTKEVVYAFEISFTQVGTMIPCGGRIMPLDCYEFVFTFISTESQNTGTSLIKEEDKSKSVFFWIMPVVLLGGLGSFYIYKANIKDKENHDEISIGSYKLKKSTSTLVRNENSVLLSEKELNLLVLLYENLNKTVERELILSRVWDDEGAYVGRTLDVFLSKLRKNLEEDNAIKITNVRGVGYKLVLEL